MRTLLFLLTLFVAVPVIAQVTEDQVIQDAIDELQDKRDTLEANKATINQASQDHADRIAAIQAVADRPGIGSLAKAHCEKMLKKLNRQDIPDTAGVDAEIAAIDALIAELQAELP